MSEQLHLEEFEQQMHQDHFIPLAKGGHYTKDNIIPSCRACNCSKQDKDFQDWYKPYEYYSSNRENRILEYIASFD